MANRERLAVLLTALEARYYPEVVLAARVPLTHQTEWVRFHRRFDSGALLQMLGWEPAELRNEAERLLRHARAIDPMAGWSDLARLIAPGRWKGLRGKALLAHDHRVAAETILLFLEELKERRHAGTALVSTALEDRLHTDRSELETVLTSFGLSPYPSVLLVTEGQTEMELLPLVMAELGMPTHDAHIRLINAKTETRDHLLLATYAALPKLGAINNGVADFIRPPTRYFIVVDADRRFRPPAAREAERQKWVQALFDALPGVMQTPMARTELESLVVVETWRQDLDFERAHFTDREIAEAALATGVPDASESLGALEARLAGYRSDMLNGHPRNLDQAWKDWTRTPSKPKLALELWQTLRLQLRRKRSRSGLDQIPCARILLRANDLAATTPRRNVVFRVS